MNDLAVDSERSLPPGPPESLPVALQMQSALRAARTWDELGDVCAEADALYQSGGLSLTQVEELAALAVAMARAAADGQPRPAVLLEVQIPAWSPWHGDRCPSCGGSERWYNHGARICAVCHPHPEAAAALARSAA
jgi:hypothetical protein